MATNVHPTLHLLAFGLILSLLLQPIIPIRFQQKIGLTSNLPLRRASPENRFFTYVMSNGRLPVHCCLGVFKVKIKDNNEGLGRKNSPTKTEIHAAPRGHTLASTNQTWRGLLPEVCQPGSFTFLYVLHVSRFLPSLYVCQ